VIHLGAGPYYEEALYADLHADHILLVEADPTATATLRESAKDPRIEVLEELIAPTEGMHAFHRFTLPSLNGILSAGGISQIYPRVREMECLSLPGHAFKSLLSRLKRAHDRPNLLIFDIPGLEVSLLEGLPSEDMENLDWVIIRDGYGSQMEGARPLTEAIRMLKGWNYAIKASDQETDSTRPLLTMGRDAQLMQLQILQNQIEVLKGQVQQVTKERDDQTCYAGEREASLEEQTRLANERYTGLETLKKQLEEAKTALEAATKGKEEQTKLANERYTGLETLKKQLEEAKTALEAATKGKEEQTRLANERYTGMESLKKSLEGIQTEKESLIKERDLLKKTETEKNTQITKLEGQVTNQENVQKQIQDEIAKAEAQLEMLKELIRPSLS
jgi:hypothetical protein